MSKAQESIDKKAREICTQLGAAYIRKKQADEQVKKLENAIAALNQIAPDILKIEQELQQSEQSE